MAGKLASQIKRLPRIWRVAHYCQEYLDHYNYYSYDFDVNGEKYLLGKLAGLNPRVIFDVGCHTGNWTKAAANAMGSTEFHCFDIAKDSLEKARKNLSGFKKAIFNLVAISDTNGTTQYIDYGSQSQLNTTLLESTWTEPGNPGRISSIKSTTGDAYCREAGIDTIDFLKLDCEGADHRALAGFSSMLDSKSIRIIQFEYGYTNGDSKYLMKDFFEFFSQFNYILAPLRPKGLVFSPWRYEFNDFKSGPNWIAIQKGDLETKRLLESR